MSQIISSLLIPQDEQNFKKRHKYHLSATYLQSFVERLKIGSVVRRGRDGVDVHHSHHATLARLNERNAANFREVLVALKRHVKLHLLLSLLDCENGSHTLRFEREIVFVFRFLAVLATCVHVTVRLQHERDFLSIFLLRENDFGVSCVVFRERESELGLENTHETFKLIFGPVSILLSFVFVFNFALQRADQVDVVVQAFVLVGVAERACASRGCRRVEAHVRPRRSRRSSRLNRRRGGERREQTRRDET
mmetsp:Transcript_2462/g.6122  ORF Transcript_2462/g.6122 Transcript_2462/m.6122 type:complete len:251 (+) Transcript_2462:1215-1967(+)